MSTDTVPAELLKLLTKEAETLNAAVLRLDQILGQLPLPSPKELALMRSGKRPVSPAVILAGLLQEGAVSIDDVTSSLTCEIEKPKTRARWDQLTLIEINHIESALEAITEAAVSRAKESG